MTATQACSSVATSTGLKAKDVKALVASYMSVAAGQLKKNGSFKFVGALSLKLKKKPATPARKGINPFTKEPCVFKAKPASQTVRALALKRLRTWSIDLIVRFFNLVSIATSGRGGRPRQTHF